MISTIKKARRAAACLVVGLVVGSSSVMYGQGQARNWYFGVNMGLNFTSSPPTLLTGGIKFSDPNYTNIGGYNVESSTTVSDADGNYLFSTNGKYIFDGGLARQSTLLSTTSDAAQGNLVMPVPGTTDKYYVVTVDAITTACNSFADGGNSNGARYRTFTISGTGAGNITNISSETTINTNSTEAQVAVPKTDGSGDYWWIMHERGSNNFKVYSVTATGFTLSNTYALGPNFTSCDYTAVLKSNNCYTKIALAFGGQVTLFDFANGVMSNALPITVPGAYGIEFSPNGNYLFAFQNEVATPKLFQYNISTAYPTNSGTSGAAILATQRDLGGEYNAANSKTGHLQLGPDGLIYVAQMVGNGVSNSSYPHTIGAITNPDVYPATFDNDYITFNDNASTIAQQRAVTMGLPTFLKSFVSSIVSLDIDGVDASSSLVCDGDNVTLKINLDNSPVSTISWEFFNPGNATATPNATATGNNISKQFNGVGKHKIIATLNDNCNRPITSTLFIDVNAKIIPAFTLPATVCASGTLITGTAGTNGTPANYVWYNTDQTTVLGTGSTYNYVGTLPKTLYVADGTPSKGPYIVGPSSAQLNGNYGANNSTFDVYSALVLESVDINQFDNGGGCVKTVTASIFKAGVLVTGLTKTFNLTTCGAQTLSLNFPIPAGTNYELRFTGTSFLNDYQGAVPNATQSGIIKINGVGGNAGRGANWKVYVPKPCVTKTKIDLVDNCCTPATITTQPAAQISCTNTSRNMSVDANTASGTLSYQWYEGSSSNTATGTWTPLTNTGVYSGATSNQLTFTNPVAGLNGKYYYVEIKVNGTCPINSSAVLLTVNTAPTVVFNPISQSICSGDPSSIGLSSTPTGATFSWTAPSVTVVTGGSASTGSPTSIAQILTNTGTANSTAVYNVTAALNGCFGTGSVTITVKPAPTVVFNPTSQLICSGDATNIGISSNLTGATFSWPAPIQPNVSGGTASTGNPTTITQTLTNTGIINQTATYNVTASLNGCSRSGSVVVTVKPRPTVSFGTNLPICSGSTSAVTLNSNIIGATFAWSAPTMTNVSGGTASTGSPTSINQTLLTSTSADGTAQYAVSATVNGCTGASNSVIITVKARPTVNPTSQSICSGANTSIALSSTPAGATFSWPDPNRNGGVTGGSTGSSPNIINQTLSTGATPGTAVYSVTATLGTCAGTAQDITVTVNPKPTVNPLSPAAICSGSNTAINLSSPTAGVTFNWTIGTISPAGSISGATAGGGTTNIVQTLNNSSAVGNLDYKVTATFGTCTGQEQIITQVVNPGISFTTQPAANTTYCEGENLSLSVTATGVPTLNYQWKLNGNNVGTVSTVSTYTKNGVTSADAGTYTVVVTSSGATGSCASATSNNAVVTVNATPILSPLAPTQSICSGTTMATVTPIVSTGTFSWTSLANGVTGNTLSGSGAISDLLSLSGSNAGTVTYTISSQNGFSSTGSVCAGNTRTHTVTVNPATQITVQPAASTTHCQGENLSLSVTATGAPALTYQWKRNGANVGTEGTVSTYTKSGVTSADDAGTYTVVVASSGATGACASATSKDAVVVVNDIPVLTTSPTDISQTICSGSPMTTVTPSVTVGSYTWTSSASSGDVTGNTGSGTGAISDVLSYAGSSTGIVTYNIISQNGASSVTSSTCFGNTITHTVNINPATEITAQPIGAAKCLGEEITLTADASGAAPLTYKWLKNGLDMVPAQTGKTLTLSNLQASDAADYTFEAFSASTPAACQTKRSNIAALKVNGVLSLAGIPGDQATCAGGTVSFSVQSATGTGSGAGLSYEWFKNGITTGVTTSTYPLSSITSSQNGETYFVKIKDDGNCEQSSRTATLTVNNVTTINSFTTNKTIHCFGDVLQFEANVGGTSPYTYKLFKGANLINQQDNIASANYSFQASPSLLSTDAGTYQLDVTSGCGNASPLQTNVKVAQTVINTQPVVSETICEGTTASLFVTATTLETTRYQWQADLGTGNFVDIPGAINSTYTTTTATTASNGYKYQVKVSDNGSCGQTSTVATVSVKGQTKTTSNPVGATLCEDSPISLSVTATGDGPLSYQWKQNGNPVGTNSATYTKNLSIASDAGSYTVEVTGSSVCPKAISTPVSVVVTPKAVLKTITSGADICEGSFATLKVLNSQTGINYQPFNGSAAVGGIKTGDGNDLDLSVSGLSAGANSITVKAGCNNLSMAPVTFNVVGSPLLTYNSPTVCQNSNQTFTANALGATSYIWKVNGTTQPTTTSQLVYGFPDFATTTISVTASRGVLTCPTTASAIITVKKDYVPNEAIIATPAGAVCEGSEVVYSIENRNADSLDIWTYPSSAILLSASSDSSSIRLKVGATGGDVRVNAVHSCEAAPIPLAPYNQAVIAIPVADAGRDTVINEIKEVTIGGLNSSTGPGYVYEWTSSDEDAIIADITSNITQALSKTIVTTYTLTVSAGDCKASDNVLVIFDLKVKIPNAFSPNGDQVHDVLELPNLTYFPKGVLTIFDQWGTQVFQSAPGYPKPWDGTRNGKELPISTYYYVFEPFQEGYSSQSGFITLLK